MEDHFNQDMLTEEPEEVEIIESSKGIAERLFMYISTSIDSIRCYCVYKGNA
jgi:hypothetical protein